MPAELEILDPRTLEEAAGMLREYGDEAKAMAGGTALVLMMRAKLLAPRYLVHIGRVPGLSYIRHEPGVGLRLGALTPLRAVERSPLVQARVPMLASAAGKVANVRVRNVATIGGNMAEADYASDPPSVLVALDGRVRVAGPEREREIGLADFFRGYYETALGRDELVAEVIVPDQPPGGRGTYLKFVSRSSEDRPCVGVAALACLGSGGICQELRVVVGAVAGTPQRVAEAEQLSVGERLTDGLIREIADRYAAAIEPIADVRGSAWYRTEMIRVHVRRAIESLTA